MSNRLTFSLASLIFLIALSLIVVPVEAEEKLVELTTAQNALPIPVNAPDGESFKAVAITTSGDTSDSGIPAADRIDAILPDLDFYFRKSALFTLIAPTAQKRTGGSVGENGTTDIKAKDVVISEIMWGLDGKTFDKRLHRQFIELYNTVADADSSSADTKEAISVKGWFIHIADGEGFFYNKEPGETFELVTEAGDPKLPLKLAAATDTSKAEYIIVDQVGNVEVVGPWTVDIGQSGSTADTGGKDLISMYRNIDYTKVEKVKTDGSADPSREEQLKGIPNGTVKDSWKASTTPYGQHLVGTPGGEHFVGFKSADVDSVTHKPIYINEIGNNSGDKHDWLELKNVSDKQVELRKWQIGEIVGTTETTLVDFGDTGDSDAYDIPAGGVLLIVNSDPHRDDDHPIAAGTRINKPLNLDTNPTKTRYYVDSNFKLSDSGATLLIVRNADGRGKQNGNEAWKGIVDLTGANRQSNDAFNTQIWPLRGVRASGETYSGDVVKGLDDEFKEGFVYKRKNANRGVGKETWEKAGYTGVGYKRSADAIDQHGGTPGFANEDPKAKASELANKATVSISEIMYQKVRNAPQWIELYNSSNTQGIKLDGWKLKIENADDAQIRTPSVTITLEGGIIIQPNQTVLIVSTTSAQTTDGIDEDHRIIDLWGTPNIKEDLEATTRRYQLLSTKAFRLTLWEKDAKTSDDPVDTAGNLGDDGTAMWTLPTMAEDADGRSSIIRRYNTGPVLGDGTNAGAKQDGTLGVVGSLIDGGKGNAGWILASESGQSHQITYYGHRDDISTAGYRGGGALPVSLSKFRPERLKDTGEIVIRWITESELNNAGFNILRSETRNGQFIKINTQLIKGQGTTSERSTYTWKDTTAKPNVVYYYQIQDVSLDGQVQTLRMSRLKGNVTAAGKLTTTWGELKALQ